VRSRSQVGVCGDWVRWGRIPRGLFQGPRAVSTLP
jgi:hypothetical protein